MTLVVDVGTGNVMDSMTELSAAAYQRMDCDKSGRVSRTVARVGNGDGTNTIVRDKTYCYMAGSTSAGGCTGAAVSDRAKIQWVKDAVDSSNTVFADDAAGNYQALVTNLDTTAFADDYDPYGVPTLTEDSGGGRVNRSTRISSRVVFMTGPRTG